MAIPSASGPAPAPAVAPVAPITPKPAAPVAAGNKIADSIPLAERRLVYVINKLKALSLVSDRLIAELQEQAARNIKA